MSHSSPTSDPLPLPPGYHTIIDIQEGKVAVDRLIRFIGVVIDWQLPRTTFGKDDKSVMTLLDLSAQERNNFGGISFNIFRAREEIPIVGPGDVILLRAAKVWQRSGEKSLITNHATSIFHYPSSAIPPLPQSAESACRRPTKSYVQLGPEEHKYVTYLYHTIDKSALPTSAKFEARASQSLNIKNCYSVLKDVEADKFYDLVVQVVRKPHTDSDKVTLYVSDYSENLNFYLHSYEDPDSMEIDGDPYGYMARSALDTAQGPYGRRMLQLSCWDSHANFLREGVKSGDWVSLRNVHVKFGRDGRYLEGFLRGRQDGRQDHSVQVLNTSGEGPLDRRLRDALHRRRDYDKDKKSQLKAFKVSQSRNSKKRNRSSLADGRDNEDKPPAKMNAKTKRRRDREALEKKEQEKEARRNNATGLNPNVVSEDHGHPLIIYPPTSNEEPTYVKTKICGDQVELPLPFTCAKYQSIFRVVDFRPNKLENFAQRRVVRDYDCLSDNDDDASSYSSSPSDSDDGQDQNAPTARSGLGEETVWEWNFALLLESLPPKAPPNNTKPRRIWALVQNADGQCLTGLDATDLRRDPHTLRKLHKTMAILWGDLEHLKAQEARQKRASKKPRDRSGDLPPPIGPSDEEDDGRGGGRGRNRQGADANLGVLPNVSNLPFKCNIRVYGVKLPAEERAKVQAEGRSVWEETYGIFGVKIRT